MIDWTKEAIAAIAVALLGWIGWLYRRYVKDRQLLDALASERTEYRERFGGGLVEHAQDIEDALEALEEGQTRCDRIHDGMADGETGPKLVARLEQKIAHVDNRLTQHILDDAEVRRGITAKLDMIIEKLSEG